MKVLVLGFFLYCLVRVAYAAHSCEFLSDVEFEYNVLEEQVVRSVDDCCQLCTVKIDCVAFTMYRSGRCSLKHTESPTTLANPRAISGRKASVSPPLPLPGALPLTLWTLEHSALTIYLFGADIPLGVYTSAILLLPTIGIMYEVAEKEAGNIITTVPHTLTDPKHRVIYVIHQSYGVDSFNFAIVQEDGKLVEMATATIYVGSADQMDISCDVLPPSSTTPTPTPTPTPNPTPTANGTNGTNATNGTNGPATQPNVTAPEDDMKEVVMGEMKMLTVTHEEIYVEFERIFNNPVVIAEPMSWNDRGGGAVPRITNVTSKGFILRIQEAPSSDGIHEPENITYIALEVGSWRLLSDGTRLEVGKVVTDATVGQSTIDNTWEVVQFSSSTLFERPPVVLSQVQTLNDFHWVKTRQKQVSTSSFAVTLEEEESNEIAHGGEIVGWMALESSVVEMNLTSEWSGHRFESGIEPGVYSKYRDRWHTLKFKQQFQTSPLFIAMLTTFDDPDSAHLRYRRLTNSIVNLRIEEDQENDWETNHYEEKVSFLALEPSLPSTNPGANVTLRAVPSECFYVPTNIDLLFYSSHGEVSIITLMDPIYEKRGVTAVVLTLPKKGTLYQYTPMVENMTLFTNNTITEMKTQVKDSLGRVLYQAYNDLGLTSKGDDSFTFQLQYRTWLSNIATVTVRIIETDSTTTTIDTQIKKISEPFIVILVLLGFGLFIGLLAFFGIFFYKRKIAREQLQGFLSLSENITDEDGGTTYFTKSQQQELDDDDNVDQPPTTASSTRNKPPLPPPPQNEDLTEEDISD